MKKEGKKWMLVALALLAVVTVTLPLVGCKNDSVSEQTGDNTEQPAAPGTDDPGTDDPGTGDTHTHTYGDWVVKTKSTETEKGTLVKKCTVCGHEGTETKDIPVGCVYVKGGTVDGTSTGLNMTEGVFAGRKVTLSDFFIGKYEVTQAEWKAVMTGNKNGISTDPSKFTGDNLPVEKVSWYDAVVYCNKRSIEEDLTPCYTLNGNTNPDDWGNVSTEHSEDEVIIKWDAITCDWEANGYRLPTEAEWEYAARGGKPSDKENDPWNYEWAGTNDDGKLEEYAWYYYNPTAGKKTYQVGTKNPNSLGIHDMSGNVWEWCWDKDGAINADTPITGPTSDYDRERRGGGCGSPASSCGVSYRFYEDPLSRDNGDVGFRVVRGL